MIRVLVANDQTVTRGTLAEPLDLERDIKVVAQAADGAQALEELACVILADDPARGGTPVDVVIIGIEMPRMDGIMITQAIRSCFPGARVLIVMTLEHPGYLQHALDAGVAGFVVKDAPAEALADGVCTVAARGRTTDQSLALEALSAGSLSPTDCGADVLYGVEGGSTIADIVHSLGFSRGAVCNHVSSSTLKIDARTRIEVASLACVTGWLWADRTDGIRVIPCQYSYDTSTRQGTHTQAG